MAYMTYPGYEIERFEDKNGRCFIRLTKSSTDNAGDTDGRKKEEHDQKELDRLQE